MKEYILLDDNNNVVKHICANDNFTSTKYKVVEAADWTEEEKIESEPEQVVELKKTEQTDDIVDAKSSLTTETETHINTCTRAEEIQGVHTEIDFASIRAIRAILSGTDTEEDYKTLKALEKRAVNLRKELNTAITNK